MSALRVPDLDLDAMDRNGSELLATLRELAAIPALGKTGAGYREVVELLARRLEETGLEVQRIEIPSEYLHDHWGAELEKTSEYIPVSRFEPRHIVFGRRKGTTPGASSLHLTQHYDLPARLANELASSGVSAGDDFVQGPGAAFCRAGIVSMLGAAKVLSAADLDGDLFVSFTPDNHLGGETGAGYLVEQGIGRSDYVITGSESGATTIGLGYKGAIWLKITTHGKTATAAVPNTGVNAIDKMLVVQEALARLSERIASRTSAFSIEPAEASGPTLVSSRITSTGWGVPSRCDLFLDRRVLPEESVTAAIDEIKSCVSELERNDKDLVVDLEVIHAVQPAGTDPQAALVQALRKNIESVLGDEPTESVLTYYTEFRLFSDQWGAQTVNYSPGRGGSVDGDREQVRLSDLIAAAKVLALTARDVLSA